MRMGVGRREKEKPAGAKTKKGKRQDPIFCPDLIGQCHHASHARTRRNNFPVLLPKFRSSFKRSDIERGILGLDLISAQAWRGTQTNSQSSSGGVSMGGASPPQTPHSRSAATAASSIQGIIDGPNSSILGA